MICYGLEMAWKVPSLCRSRLSTLYCLSVDYLDKWSFNVLRCLGFGCEWCSYCHLGFGIPIMCLVYQVLHYEWVIQLQSITTKEMLKVVVCFIKHP
jgi:hypothetical protein